MAKLTLQQQVMAQVLAVAQSGESLDLSKLTPAMEGVKAAREKAIESATQHGKALADDADTFFRRCMELVDQVRALKVNHMAAVAYMDQVIPQIDKPDSALSTVVQYQRKARQLILNSGEKVFDDVVTLAYGKKADGTPNVTPDQLQFSNKTQADIQKLLTARRAIERDVDIVKIDGALREFAKLAKFAPRKVNHRDADKDGKGAKTARNAIPAATVLGIIEKAGHALEAEYTKAQAAASKTVQEPRSTPETKAAEANKLAKAAEGQQQQQQEGIQAPAAAAA